MQLLEKAVIDLLRNHTTLPNEKIFTGNRYRPYDVSPCITIQQASETPVSAKQIPGEYETIKIKHNAEVWINIWCNTEEERQSLIDQVELRLFQALADHNTTCGNYTNGDCLFLQGECQTINVVNGRTAKNQCPYPKENRYVSWFKQNQIVKSSFTVNGNTDLDELDLTKPILRTIVKISMDYYKTYNVGGHQINNVSINEELL